ncbi:MAG: TOBE domain-containing protein [Rhodospirillales bacterium]|nr:TOBE domain-containing protein [Rhodospirillales bacterium]
MKLSARNVITGRVVEVKKAKVAANVKVDIGGGTVISSSILSESIEDLGIAVGDEVSVVIKSSDVILAK